MEREQRSLMSSLWHFSGDYKKQYGTSILFALIGVLGGFIPFFSIAQMVICLVGGEKRWGVFGAWCIVAGMGYIIRILFCNWSTSISHKATFYALKDMREEIVKKLAKMPMGKILDIPSGYFKDIIVDRVESLEVTLAHLLPEMTANILGPLALIIYLFILDWRMALVSLITIPIGAVFMSVMMKPYKKQYEGSVDISKQMSQTVVEYVNGIEVIKTFNQSAKSYQKYADAVKNNAAYFYNWMKSCQLPMSAYMAICPSSLITVLPVGYLFFINGSLSSTDFITIIILVMASIGPLMTSLNYTDSLAVAGTIVSEIESILSAPELIRPKEEVNIPNLGIQFKDVSFTYDEKSTEPVLKKINLTITQGKVTALVGPSGSGKSTLAKLIAGFWDVSGGSITLGGINLQAIPRHQLTSQIAYVSQDNYLFDDTIMENIRMGKKGASDKEVIEVAKASGCDSFISELQNGYHTVVGGAGTHLSGGERQRIAIARAMLKNAPIIILDEATAYTDPENEAIIQRSVSRLVEGKTLIVIAHRLSTIIDSDAIIVVKNGEIVAEGTHEKLLSQSELYSDMWAAHIGVKDGEER